MATKIERNKDGSIKGITTMGDLIGEGGYTREQWKKIRDVREQLEKNNEKGTAK